MFPYGAPGYGLLLLRVIVAVSLHIGGSGHLEQPSNLFMFTALILVSTLLLVGLLKPAVALLGAVLHLTLVIANGSGVCFASFIGPLNALVLMLLGPGAHSIDAHLFGRRRIVLGGKIR